MEIKHEDRELTDTEKKQLKTIVLDLIKHDATAQKIERVVHHFIEQATRKH